jgi:tripeptide aminopeptidase
MIIIVSITHKGRTIKFCESARLMPDSVAKIGKTVGLAKLDVDRSHIEELTEAEVLEYCFRDCDIVLKGLQFMRDAFKSVGADFAYTVDGETLGSLENETFSADGILITIRGISSHPGFAKGKMESALKIAAEIIAQLPKERLSPESTQAKEGFLHPVAIRGTVEEATLEFIIRDFTEEGLQNHASLLEEITRKVMSTYPKSQYELQVKEQYRNMKKILDQHPAVVEFGLKAIRRAGLEPKLQSIRGGTDGSRLSFMGLPCPNIFAGEHAFHSKLEWVSVQDMEKAVESLVHLITIWEEKS